MEHKKDVNPKESSRDVGAAQVPSISLPKGGGAIRGIGEKFAANPVTGTGSMTVPIATSPGRSGFSPQLALSYDSGVGNGPFGFGWSLSIPAISRKTDKGLPQYRDTDESDVYILSGAEDLVPVIKPDGTRFKDDTTTPGYVIHRYRPRIEGLFARIERWTSVATGEIHWRSITRDNITTLYGKDDNSRILEPVSPMTAHAKRIFTWLICASYDDKGNAIIYQYAEENGDNVDLAQANERNRVRTANRYLKRIKYGNRAPNRIVSSWQVTDATQLPDDTWMFEAVFDYDEGHFAEDEADTDGRVFVQALTVPRSGSQWGVRMDPFSSYRAGFEVRTYRLCHRVLMFHHFPDELGINDCLVRSTEFTYSESPVASFITSVTQSGYVRQPIQNQPNRYLKKSLPLLEFEYSQVPRPEELAQQPIREVDAASLENLPIGLDGASYQWMDLDGEGTSGILTEQADGWYYKRNLSAGNTERDDGNERAIVRFGPIELVASKPAATIAGAQFLDLAGDGQVDLVRMEGPLRGFYERTNEDGWTPFRPFKSWPDLDTRDPDLRFVDLTGDGHADILITEGKTLTWYPSFGEEGFGRAVRISLPSDEERGPQLVFSDGAQSVHLADLSGDGLSDIVRIRNGEVCYWPNLGYGRFGAKVTMDNAPRFDAPDQFDQRRIQLADIDGSGVTDIIYLGRDGVRLYFNQSGNGWSEVQSLTACPQIENMSSVTAVDLLGNGTACLVWSSPLPGRSRRPMFYLDLMGGHKPHLMVRTKNNMGAESIVHYAASTKFYLADKAAGKPWITHLPFPVHVVERVETVDRISRNRFVNRYAYHHGYFDGGEREFRGFGMVEQWDTEEFAALSERDAVPGATNLDDASHVPPVLTRTWFHTGAWLESGRIGKQFENEYYREGDTSLGEAGLSDEQLEVMLLDDTILPSTILLPDGSRIPHALTAEEMLEGSRALKGSILRQEVYGLDGTEEEDRPYTVSERNYTIEMLQRRSPNRHAVFFAHPQETIDFHYERKLFDVGGHKIADPRVTHSMTLEVDSFGNVLKSVSIGYGRRHDVSDPSLTGDDKQKQKQTLITYTESDYTNAVLENDDHRAPLLCDARTYEVRGVEPAANQSDVTNLFRFDEMARILSGGLREIPYELVTAPDSKPGRRLIERVVALYRRDDLTAALQHRELQPRAIPFESYRLAFTSGLLSSVYRRKRKTQTDEDLLESSVSDTLRKGGYVELDLDGDGTGDGTWWIPSGRVFFNPDENRVADELDYARTHFFLPHRFQDPFGNNTFLFYDNTNARASNNLLVTKTRDAIGNEISANNDYRVLKPWKVTDPNGNRTEAAFDALGMVVGTAVMGKEGEQVGDSLDGFKADLVNSTIRDHLTDPASDRSADLLALLGSASTRMVYDLHQYLDTSANSNPQPNVVYTIARETHHHDELERGEASKVQLSFSYSDGFGREIQKKIQAEPGPLDLDDPNSRFVDPRWVGSGWTIFNNKGKPVRQYEPFFSSTRQFEFARTAGVSPVMFYDPVERVVATLHPNHVYEKVLFDPWRQETWDVNDTLTLDPRTDSDVSSYTAGYFNAQPGDWETWLQQRKIDPQHPPQDSPNLDPEPAAAVRTLPHAGTPTVTYLDTLGRAFLTVSHNRFKRTNNGTTTTFDEKYPTRLEIDIEGNQREVIDAKGRVVMSYDYDMLGNRIHQASIDAGDRWMLNDVAGKLIRRWDSRDQTFQLEYDELRRPVRSYVTGADPKDATRKILFERVIYGDGPDTGLTVARVLDANLRTKPYKHFDTAGVVVNTAYDFKGNLLGSTSRLLADYKSVVDWSQDLTLENEVFAGSSRFDALNRVIQQVAPHSDQNGAKLNVIQPAYNEANLLERLYVWQKQEAEPAGLLDPATASLRAVTNIDYNVKGQRVLIEYGILDQNGESRVGTEYTYDPETFRLVTLKTTRKGFPQNESVVQDLRYTYDPAGNITHIRDDSQQTIYFSGQRVEPSNDYAYDANYRLIFAEGREHIGQNAMPDHEDKFRINQPHPGDTTAMRRYRERYEYDEVGNILKIVHTAGGAQIWNPSWTRRYAYDPNNNKPENNRLMSTSRPGDPEDPPYSNKYTYDAHGNMTTMPHLLRMEWDFRDQLQSTERQVVNNGGTPETTYYVYDASGQRVRKVTEGQAFEGAKPALKAERIYLGGFEVYREYNGNGINVTLERETLHVMDDKRRIALVEMTTIDAKAGSATPPRNLPISSARYQLSNHLGSASLELNGDGSTASYQEYHPYGSSSYQAVRSNAHASVRRYGYTGKERDVETGLYYQGARYYAPWLGRWISSDKAGLVDGPNLYLYAKTNPVMFVDPNGKDARFIIDGQQHVITVQTTIHLYAEKGAREGLKDVAQRASAFFANPTVATEEDVKNANGNPVPSRGLTARDAHGQTWTIRFDIHYEVHEQATAPIKAVFDRQDKSLFAGFDVQQGRVKSEGIGPGDNVMTFRTSKEFVAGQVYELPSNSVGVLKGNLSKEGSKEDQEAAKDSLFRRLVHETGHFIGFDERFSHHELLNIPTNFNRYDFMRADRENEVGSSAKRVIDPIHLVEPVAVASKAFTKAGSIGATTLLRSGGYKWNMLDFTDEGKLTPGNAKYSEDQEKQVSTCSDSMIWNTAQWGKSGQLFAHLQPDQVRLLR